MRATSLIAAATATAALAIGPLGPAPADAGAGAAPTPAGRAAVATTLGQAGGTLTTCNGGTVPAGVTLDTAAAGSPAYVAPTNGVLTSFTTVTNSKAGQVRALVLGAAGTPDRLVVAGRSAKETVAVSKSNTFATRLPILAGQRLGLGWTVSGMACAVSGAAADVSKAAAPFDPDTTTEFVYSTTLTGFRPNISAVLEPDVDADGYGDVSQDACPESALSQVACPAPDTILTKKPKKHRGSSRVKLTFASTIAGSTFECSRDGHRFKPCSSPYQRHFGPGKHKLLIRAITAVGIPDPSPIKLKFRIR